jgi:transcriptional regulator with XRE-family HTH domain
MEQLEWGPRLVRTVAGQIRRWRTKRGMSAQALSDACAKLGWPIKRSVLSNLESGYRETITVPEMFILAQALEVPPLLLLLPLGDKDTVEVRPGTEVPTKDALRWFLGERPLRGTRWEGLDTEDGSPTIASFQVHQQSVDRWSGSRFNSRQIRQGVMLGTADDADEWDRSADRTAEQLRNLRAMMRARGLAPPPLPPEMRHIEEASSSGTP